MQIYFPNIKTKQAVIGIFDYLIECHDTEESNVIFNSDLNLTDYNDRVGGKTALVGPEPVEDSDIKFLAFVLENFQYSRAQRFQDLYVLWKLDRKTHGVFAEIGTAYPDLKNNTYYLEKQIGWTGLCVEPNPVFHAAIQQLRSSPLEGKAVYSGSIKPKLKILQKFSPGGGIDIDYEFKDQHESTHDIQEIEIDTLSLVDCLNKHRIDKNFDYLSYDTTGNIDDVHSLQQILEFGYRPSVITIGHNYKSHRPLLLNLLTSYDYCREFDYLSQWDDWYFLKHRSLHHG